MPEATVQFGGHRRKDDIVQHTIIAIAIIVASTALAWKGRMTPETTVAAWGLASAIVGTPIVIRRNPQPELQS